MTIINAAAGGLFIGVIAAAIYGEVELARLRRKLAELKRAIREGGND